MSSAEYEVKYPTSNDVRNFGSPDIGLSPEGERVAFEARLATDRETARRTIEAERARREAARSQALQPPVVIEPVQREIQGPQLELTE